MAAGRAADGGTRRECCASRCCVRSTDLLPAAATCSLLPSARGTRSGRRCTGLPQRCGCWCDRRAGNTCAKLRKARRNVSEQGGAATSHVQACDLSPSKGTRPARTRAPPDVTTARAHSAALRSRSQSGCCCAVVQMQAPCRAPRSAPRVARCGAELRCSTLLAAARASRRTTLRRAAALQRPTPRLRGGAPVCALGAGAATAATRNLADRLQLLQWCAPMSQNRTACRFWGVTQPFASTADSRTLLLRCLRPMLTAGSALLRPPQPNAGRRGGARLRRRGAFP
jgi:hypothetical protein